MAALTTLKGKVLVQIGDGEPVEVGQIEIPLEFKPQNSGPVQRDLNGLNPSIHVKANLVESRGRKVMEFTD